MEAASSRWLMDVPHPRGRTAHTCFHLSLFWSHYRTHSLSHCCYRGGTFEILPRSPPSGNSGCCSVACTSYLCSTVNSYQQLRVLVWEPRGHGERQVTQRQEELGTCPYQIPRPNGLQVGAYSQRVFGDGVDFITGVPHFSLRDTGLSVHPTVDIPGGEVPMQDGCGLCLVNIHTP